MDINGNKKVVCIKDVSYVPQLKYNIYSITKAIEKGTGITNDGKVICLTRKQYSLKFDRLTMLSTGFVGGFHFIPFEDFQQDLECVATMKSISINTLHNQLGHPNQVSTQDKDDIFLTLCPSPPPQG